MGRNISPDMCDPWMTLQIPRGASPDEVRKAWKKLIIKCHPDKVGDDGTAFRKVQTAYEFLNAQAKMSPVQKQKDKRRREQEKRRRDYERQRQVEREAQERAFAERREAHERAKQAAKEAEEEARKARQQAERRIMAEGKKQYEERLEREKHEAYMERCRQYEEKQKQKRKEYDASRSRTWADTQADRHRERFQSRYRRFMEHTEVPSSGGADSSSDGGAVDTTNIAAQGVTAQAAEKASDSGSGHSVSSPGAMAPDAQEGSKPEARQEFFGKAAAETFFWERRREEVMRNLLEPLNYRTAGIRLPGWDPAHLFDRGAVVA